MSSSLFSVGRLDRKFVYESSGNPNERKLRYNDPSFITFRILFDFEPIVSNDEVMQGLLLNESRDESAVNYLRRMGEFERAEALREFTWLLNRITNDFPWFFKSINGISGLWKWGHVSNDGLTQSAPIDLSIECYETVDLRMTALADLYRKASRDRNYFRELLTLDKKRFNMTVLVGEARNLRSYTETNSTNWLNHVSTVAFRCLDCEFDFSGVIPASLDGSEAPTQITPSFGIKVHRVQETNSYLLLNYMLGEIKRDLVIKQGGSGAEVNQSQDIINYRSLLAPFVRSYEGNYNQVLLDTTRNINQNFSNQLTLVPGDRVSSLPYRQRQVNSVQQLNGISKEGQFNAIGNSLLQTSIQTANITGDESLISFGRPTVDSEISDSVDLTAPNLNPDGTKIDETVANQIQFTKPKVETGLPDFSFNRPNVATQLDDNVGLTKPTVQTEITNNVGLAAPTVNEDQGENIDLMAPIVDRSIDNNVGLVAPTVQDTIDENVQFERPTVQRTADGSISFGRPTVATAVDSNIVFVKPTVLGNISENIAFEKPKVENDFES